MTTLYDILSTPATNLTSNTNGAGRMRFTKTTVGSNGGVVESLWCQPSSMAAGAKARMFIYSDNAGVPGTKLGTSDEVTFSAISTFTMVEFPFSVQPTLAAATPYWIAIQQDTSMVATLCATSPGGYLLDGFAYGSAPASAAGATSSIAFSFWGRIAWTGTPATLSAPLVSVAAGVGNNNKGNYGTILGPYTADDLLLIQFTYTTVGSTVPTFITPPGATSIDSRNIGTVTWYLTQIYYLRIAAGQNPRIPLELSAGQGAPSIGIALFRGITTATPYEAVNKAGANSGNAVTANTVTTGNNRILCTFFAFDANYTGSSPSGSWAERWETPIASTQTVMMDTLSAPTTGTYTADTRNPNFNRWAAISLALIQLVVYDESVSETATAADTLSAGGDFGVSVAESVTATDTVSSLGSFLSTVVETAVALDTVITNADYSVGVLELSNSLDTVSAIGSFGVGVVEAASAADTLSARVVFLKWFLSFAAVVPAPAGQGGGATGKLFGDFKEVEE